MYLLLSQINQIGAYLVAGVLLFYFVFMLATNPVFASKRNKKQFERADLRKRIGLQIDKWDKDETKPIAKDLAMIQIKTLMEQFLIEKEDLK